MAGLTYDAATDADRGPLGRILAHCFGFPPEEAADWFARAGEQNLRVLRRGDRVTGGLIVIPMGQYFGGRSIPMIGIAGVGISPEERGRGAATVMMRELVHEVRRAGAPLSTLYPATVPLYRAAGYGRAGARYEITIAPGAAATRSRELVVERVERVDDEDLPATYARYAARRQGFLDRGPYVWGRVVRPRKASPELFKVMGAEGCEGYASITHRMEEAGSVVVTNDLVALNARAAARVLDLLSGYGSVATSLRFFGAAPDLLTSALPERRHTIRATDYWMLRLCDVVGALSARGYPPGVDATLELEVDDDVIAENAGRYRLRVRDGRGAVERGGTGAIRVDVRALAALFSGFHDARTLRDLGELTAREEHLDVADAVFAGRAPAMSDFF